MSRKLLKSRPWNPVYDNQVQAFDPQFWANESLAILEENMILGQLVNRDFEPIIANFGDTVNTRRVGEFAAIRKGTTDNVTVQDATATNVQVVLNHHVHTSFLIRDGEESKSITSLVDTYMAPSMIAQARYVDHVLAAQVYQFLGNSYGRLGHMDQADVTDRITGVRNILNKNKAPMQSRNMILTPNTETYFLKHTDFTQAFAVGDQGTALREANLGRLYGFDNFMAQNEPSITPGVSTIVVGAVNNAAGYAAGATTMTVDGFAAAIIAGSWFKVDGDDVPQRVVSTVGGATPTSITFAPGLKTSVLDNAAVTIYTPGQVNFDGGYAAGWTGPITVDGFSVAPQIGQMLTFGTAANTYGVLSATTTSVTLDRPLDVAINDNDYAEPGPAGEYNFAFLRDALTMVVRPLAVPRAGIGALSSVVSLNNLSMRAVLTYDGNKQGTLVTLDMLMGVTVLDTRLGAVLLA